MPEKLDKLSNDILTLLKKAEPNRLRNYEIVESLWKAYQHRYKDQKTFSVAVSQKLRLLKAEGLIVHEDIWYGTPQSQKNLMEPCLLDAEIEQIKSLWDNGDIDKAFRIVCRRFYTKPEKWRFEEPVNSLLQKIYEMTRTYSPDALKFNVALARKMRVLKSSFVLEALRRWEAQYKETTTKVETP